MTALSSSPAPSQPTFVVGHKNPDADAICSAIAYAAFKDARGERGYVAARCGNSNARIDTILARFRQPLPYYLSDVSPRVHDLMTPDVVSILDDATCAEALELIDQHQIRVLPVINSRHRAVGTLSLAHLGGVFIPRVSEPKQMRQVRTSLSNIARALRGRHVTLRKPDGAAKPACRDVDQHQVHRPLAEQVFGLGRRPARQGHLAAIAGANARPFDLNLAAVEADLASRLSPPMTLLARATPIA